MPFTYLYASRLQSLPVSEAEAYLMPLYGSLAHSHVNFEIVSPEDWLVFQEIFVDRCYAPAVDAWLPRFSEPRSTHLDLGSNTGYFSTYLAHRLLSAGLWNFKIKGVDGNLDFIELANKRASNQQTVDLTKKLAYHHGLVGAKYASAQFTLSNEGRMNCIVPPSVPGINVHYEDLDLLIPETCGVLKCDVEGAEEAFLETYHETLLKRTQVACFEFHHAKVNLPRCRELLQGAGLLPVTCVTQGGVSVEVFSR